MMGLASSKPIHCIMADTGIDSNLLHFTRIQFLMVKINR